MELSAKVEYALLALLELASHPIKESPHKVSEIAARQGIPERYLEQVLMSLRRGGIVQSLRGAKGGYVLARESWKITLFDIVLSIEGEVNAKENQSDQTLEKSILQDIWREAHTASAAILQQYTLQDLCQKRDAYQLINPMYYI
ncbi:MAG: Rrf2 family transcriptional regulator [Microcoleus sp. SIO2G3]|nr:Rrf2 family transcriptional regulator [Microcoleus sp. SIO2G3]